MPGGHLRPNLNQTEPARHRNHLIPVRLPTAPAATPRMGGTSPGTPAAAQMLEALLGVRTLHPAQPRCQHGADQPGEDFRAGCPPCTPGAAPRGPRYVGSCPGSPQTPPPPHRLQHTTQNALSGGFFCQAMSNPTDGKDGRSKPTTTRAALMPRRVKMDVRGRDAVLGGKGTTPLGTGHRGT